MDAIPADHPKPEREDIRACLDFAPLFASNGAARATDEALRLI